MRAVPFIPQLYPLGGIVQRNMLNCRMRSTCAAFAGSFGGQLGAPSASAGRSVGSVRARPWQKLFCSVSNEPQQQRHVQEQRQQELNGSSQKQEQQRQQRQQQPSQLNSRGATKLDPPALLALEESEPLCHSNPDIQLLLDRYTRLCDGEVTTAASPVFGKADRRSPSRAVFSNTNVDLSRVEVVGFDYDYTLATCECIGAERSIVVVAEYGQLVCLGCLYMGSVVLRCGLFSPLFCGGFIGAFPNEV